MIPADLLQRLQEADPELWKEYDGLELAEVTISDEDGEYQEYTYVKNLIPEATEAWLQACLQAAIQARKWQGIILFNSDHRRAVIEKFTDGWGGTAKLAEKEGSTEAEALMRAYLSALSGERI